MTSKPPSQRAKEFWRRMLAWYGARVGDQYGTLPPDDWCRSIDAATRRAVDRALDEIKIHHPVYPPTFPEFYSMLERYSKSQSAVSDIERLRDHVVKHRQLTRMQLFTPWEFHCLDDGGCVFVDIPPDGDVPGFRVRLEDLPHA